jgi:two-component system, chemotaxis family, chemotaxis protein CheY
MWHVLVTDDSAVVRKIARRALESAILRVSEAPDVRQALTACSISMPDGILVDAGMPMPGGIEFVKQLRRMQSGNRPSVILCLNENDAGQIARAIRAGADDFMLKPFDASHVRSKFAAFLPQQAAGTAIPLWANRR